MRRHLAVATTLGLFTLVGCALSSIELNEVLQGRGRHLAEITGRPDDQPFFPLEARVKVAGAIAKPGTFLSAENCVTCHEDYFKAWSQSVHARAWTDRLYRKLLARVEADGGPAWRRACTGCHTPAGVLEGVVPGTMDEAALDDAQREGVTCHVCHSIDSLRGPAHGQSLLFDPGDQSALRTMRGPYSVDTQDFHTGVPSELHQSSELCAACHDVYHPIYRFRLETPFGEWRASPYAAAGVQCQDCHMSKDGGAAAKRLERAPGDPGPIADDGPDRPRRHYHGFVGGNSIVSSMFAPGGSASKKKDRAFKKHQGLVDELLKNAADVVIDAPAFVDSGATVELDATVVNSGAGHNLPTGVDMIRELWLAVEAKDAQGRVVFRSGGLDRARRVDPAAPRFGRTFVDAAGQTTIEPWRARAIKADTTIPPKGRATARYRIALPADAVLPVRVTATLRMRVAPQDIFDRYMGPETFELPVVDMAQASVELKPREGAPSAVVEAKGERE